MKDENAFRWDPRILRSLQYFEAVARHGSVKAAAEEHGVSASAISHKLSELSGFVGEELVVRSGRGIRLTESGLRLYRHLSVLFSDLEKTLREVIGSEKAHLRLAVCSSFGPAWLARRLPDLTLTCPRIDLELRMFAQDPMQTETVADAIVTADQVADGFDHVTLFSEMLVAVVRPGANTDVHGMPAQLVTTDLQPKALGAEWREFSRVTGRDFVGAAGGRFIRSTHYVLALALARAGIGAALVPDFLAEDALASGDVALVDRTTMSSGRIYKLCYKSSRSRDSDLREFARWIKGQAEFVASRAQIMVK
jgi:DNA-binding transcriptional LysR family regulator